MQQRSQETRARIINASLKCFAKQGFNDTSIQQICEEAEISKGAFYHHFSSKQTLFLELLNSWLDSIELNLSSIKQKTVPETLLLMTDILPGVIESADDQITMFLEFWLQASRDNQIWEATIAPYHHYQGIFENLIRQGIEEGSFATVNPKPAAQMLVSMAVGLLLQGILDPNGSDWRKTARESMEIFLRGLKG